MTIITPPDANANEQATINKALKVNELRRTLKTSNEKIADGKKLLDFYLSEGYMEMEAGKKLPRVIPKVPSTSFLLDQGSIAENTPWAKSSGPYLDDWFPKGGKLTKTTYVYFYEDALTENHSVEFAPYYRKTVISTQVSYWENLLKGKERRNRVLKIRSTIDTLEDIVASAKRQLDALGAEYVNPIEKNLNNLNGNPNNNTSTTPDAVIKNNYDNKPIEYNVGMVNEAYFSPKPQWQQLANTRGGNKPQQVDNAMKLWDDARSNKGMIWLYSDGSDTYSIEPEGQKPDESTKKRYAFQFHYNPSSIDMAWAGMPGVDPAQETSGRELYNLINGETMSTISFGIILNRMFDMQYYTNEGKLKPGRRGDKNPYSPMRPDTATQKRIYNYGTMYDVEYLLSAILGYKLNTRFRGKTSDIGFLSGRPVDVYLGNRLRYWGYISDITLTHQFFDERMVPTFTVMSITLSRIPDYQV